MKIAGLKCIENESTSLQENYTLLSQEKKKLEFLKLE